MKINIDTTKEKEAVSKFLQKTSDFGKKTISDVQAGAVALAEKSKQDSYMRRLKKYNPLFPDVFYSVEFNLPNMIMIRDDAERRGIDVCEGAIGWLGKESGMEVLYLYDEAIPTCGLRFVPTADCNAVYYVDKFDRNKFIRTDYVFKNANDERLAELENIAYSLGAKHCTIDLVEIEKVTRKAKNRITNNSDVNVKIDDNGDRVELDSESTYNSRSEITHHGETRRCSESFWDGSDKPRRPKLKWFAYDDSVKLLIEMRCKGGNSVRARSLEFQGSNIATMSKNTACCIDSALRSIGSTEGKANTKGNAEFEKQATRELKSKFIFRIEF